MRLSYAPRFLLTPLIMIVSGVGLISLQLPQLEILQNRNLLSPESLRQQEEWEELNLTVLNQVAKLGFDNLIADWVWLKFLIYFGDTDARNKIGYSITPQYFESIVNLDPQFVEAYLYLSPATSVYAARPEKTIELMDKGLESISPESPKAFFVWFYKAVDELLFIGDSQAAKESYEMAAKWADIQNEPQIAARARETAQFLETNPDSRQARVGAWVTVLANVQDRETQEYVIEQIEKLGGTVTIEPNGRVRVQAPRD